VVNREAILNGNWRFANAVHAAAMASHVHIAEVLLDAGAKVNIKVVTSPNTALEAAAY